MSQRQSLPQKIRVSVGSTMVLGLLKGILDAPPTTIYLLTYRDEKCLANCGFCPQARTSTSRVDMLARVTWPAFPLTRVVEKIVSLAPRGGVKRVCIQALNYPKVFDDILHMVQMLHSRSEVSISVSCQPLERAQMRELKQAGVDHVSIALDAATEGIFDKVKGKSTQSPYDWKRHQRALKEAVEIFGKNHVYTHLIVGLGETEKEIVETIQWCTDSGAYPSLFAFTPIPGTALESATQPKIETYRRVQLARYLIVQGRTRFKSMRFDEKEQIIDFGVPEANLKQVVLDGTPFRTSGCPECNRPYYNERPGGPMYNYPRKPSPDEIDEIKKQFEKDNSWTLGTC